MTGVARHTRSVLLAGVTLALAAAVLPAAGPAVAAPGAGTGTDRTGTGTERAAARATWRVNGTVYAVAVVGRRVYVGGDFDRVSTAAGVTRVRHNLVAFRRGSGQLVPGWNPATNGPVRALAPSKRTGRLFVGGGFTRAGDGAHPNVAAVSMGTGNVIDSWRGSTNGAVRDIVLLGSRVYLAGAFFQVRGARQHGLGALTVSRGARVDAFGGRVGPLGQVTALALSSNRRTLVVGGSFEELSGANRSHLGSVRLSSGLPTRWRPASACGACSVLDLRTDGRRVYASMAGNGGRVVAYRTSTASTLWSSRGDGDVQALALMGGTLYVGGHFSQFRGQNRVQAAALSPATGRLRGWRPAFRQPNNPGVWAITPGTDFVRVGGGFIHVGRADIRGYVEFRVG
jgi:hypothetical protein